MLLATSDAIVGIDLIADIAIVVGLHVDGVDFTSVGCVSCGFDGPDHLLWTFHIRSMSVHIELLREVYGKGTDATKQGCGCEPAVFA